MVNKPINPAPYHEAVDVLNEFKVKCEVDYKKELSSNFSIYDKESGDVCLSANGNYSNNFLSTDININSMAPELLNGKDYMWQVAYCNELRTENTKTITTNTIANKNTNTIEISVNPFISTTGKTSTTTLYNATHVVYCGMSSTKQSELNDALSNGGDVIIIISDNEMLYKGKVTKCTSNGDNYAYVYFKRTEGKTGNDNYWERVNIFQSTGFVNFNIYDIIKKDSNNYYRIDNYITNETTLTLTVTPPLREDISANSTLTVFPQKDIDYQESPYYYFRARSTPNFYINDIENNIINAPFYTFSGTYSQNEDVGLNFVQFKISVFDSKMCNYVEIKKSEKIYDFLFNSETSAFEFSFNYSGLLSGHDYKIELLGYSDEGDNLFADSKFVNVLYETSDCDIASFSKDNSCIRLDFSSLLSSLTAGNVVVKVFRHNIDTDRLFLVGNFGLSFDGNISLNVLYDYNIASFKSYQYIIGVSNSSDEYSFYLTNKQTVYFEGTSLIGLNYLNNYLNPIKFWNFELSEDQNLNDLNYELSRNYSIGFGKHKTVSMNNLNSMSSSCSHFLGNIKDCEYVETEHLKEEWLNFVNDDTIKLFRSVSGEIAIISIDSTSIKPMLYGSNNIARTISFSFTQIDDTDDYSICSITKEEE